MTVAFDERSLRFEFDDRWQMVLKWDDHVAYRKGVHEVRNSKAMDFVGLYDGRLIYLIEARDYRNYLREKEEDPRDELEQKIRDTVAGLVGSGRRPEYAEEFRPLMRALLNQSKIIVVLWNEQPPYSDTAEAIGQRKSAGSGMWAARTKLRVKWLHARIITASQADWDNGVVPGLTIKNRARKPRELAAAILKRLRDSGILIDPVARQRIVSHTEVKDLEAWLERAGAISKVEELFDDRR